MINTHASHFGLEIIAETDTGIVMVGTLANCKRMAFAHGMEIEKHEGRVMAINGRHAVCAPTDEANPNRVLFVNGGLIQKTVGDYTLVIPRTVWEAK